MLFQSCRVYQHKPATLDQAISEGKRVKIRTFDNKTYTYKTIEKVDGVYFGVKNKRKEQVRTPIDESEIKKVRLHNVTMSIVYGVLIGSITILMALIVGGGIVLPGYP